MTNHLVEPVGGIALDTQGCWDALNRIKNKSRIEEEMDDDADSVSLYHYLSRKYKDGVAPPCPLKVCLGSGSVEPKLINAIPYRLPLVQLPA